MSNAIRYNTESNINKNVNKGKAINPNKKNSAFHPVDNPLSKKVKNIKGNANTLKQNYISDSMNTKNTINNQTNYLKIILIKILFHMLALRYFDHNHLHLINTKIKIL